MSQLEKPLLDHVVINVGAGLDDAVQRYQALGFQLTQRGHHTLGSSNHLAMFDDTYLELLGVEPAKALSRPDLLSARLGLNAVVFKTTDAEELCTDLRARGADDANARSFSRPVPEGGEARFRTVNLPDVKGIAGRSFFCEHQTPDRVWQSGLSPHPNGVNEILGFLFVSEQPDETLSHYARWFDDAPIQTGTDGHRGFRAGRARIVCCTSAQFESAYGLETTGLEGESGMMAAVHLRTTSMESLLNRLATARIPYDRRGDGCLVIAAPHANGVGLIFSH